ncbi:cytochrome P450 3A19-like isoform X1 [Mytilus californianus]|uniref:cytochrome P450 3A19-like isoform X1 n=2 Tax=Mytilus californianus TaxID=6549 RepID=UPI00224649A5|nr:cytochrome P450 3A19-like isoform X1 [Mytilus californianus]
MQQQLTQEVNELCKCFSPGNATDPLEHFYNSALNVVSIMAFGKRLQYNDQEFKTLRSSITYVFKHGQSLGRMETFFSWLALFSKSQVNEVVGEIDKLHAYIKQKLKNHSIENNHKLPHDLLAAYLNLSESERKDSALSETNLFQAIIDMYIAAYDTYTATMMIIVYYLLKYPDVQKKCREEIHKVCKGKGTVTFDDKDKLRYVESTIKEVLRIAKPVVLAIYRTIKRNITVDGYNIPAKSIILYDLNDPQVDSTLWDNPNVFDPDRWTNPQTNGYLPFGLGPRRCVGAPTVDMSLFLMITNILHKFELVPEDKNNLPMEREWSGVALFPKPFKMYIKPVEY